MNLSETVSEKDERY